MEIFQVTKNTVTAAIQAAVSVLRAGGLVVYPTETTYGIAVDIENPTAVQKLLDYKGKRDGKPISVAVLDEAMAARYVNLNDTARKVYQTFLPGPVTVISTGTGVVAPGVASVEGKVGIRIPKHDLATSLIEAFGHGISATGANASNQRRPYTINDILDHTSKLQQSRIDLVLDIGTLPPNEPSTVIDTTVDDIRVLRQGPTLFNRSETFISHSEAETKAWCMDFVRRYRSYFTYVPVLFLFSGEMGAGKTHAIAGIAAGLGISHEVSSPTYAVAAEYSFRNEGIPAKFVHVDCWKLGSFVELKDIGLEEEINQKSVLAIEWADRFEHEFHRYEQQAKVIWVRMIPGTGEYERIISYSV